MNKIREGNLNTFQITQFPNLVQRNVGSFDTDVIVPCEIREEGEFVILKKEGNKKIPREVRLAGADMMVEKKPIDSNRQKAITANYLRWPADPRMDNPQYRVNLNVQEDLKTKLFSFYLHKRTDAENLMNYLLIKSKGLEKSKDVLRFSIVGLFDF